MPKTKTKRHYTSKKQRMCKTIIKGVLILFGIYFLFNGIFQIGLGVYHFLFDFPELAIAEVNYLKEPKIEFYEVVSETIRETTAYNAGDPYQCDDDPCISANGENICTALAMGYKRCAANFVPFGTRLFIDGFGECLVTDRMNSRYQNRVDIAMMADEKQRAINFGLQKLNVKILK